MYLKRVFENGAHKLRTCIVNVLKSQKQYFMAVFRFEYAAETVIFRMGETDRKNMLTKKFRIAE